MSTISLPYTFSPGAVIVAAQHNSNFSTVYNDYNGNIDNTNISGSAAIAYSKLNLTGNIVNADINASAAIVDTKLAQITTASKVSGTAITGLASLPSGAGIVPVANLGTGSPSSSNFLRGDGSFATAGGLSLLSNTSVSAVTTSGNISISASKLYLIILNLKAVSGSNTQFSMRFNADSTAAYEYTYSGDAVSSAISAVRSTGQTQILLGGTVNGGGSFNIFNGRIFIQFDESTPQNLNIDASISAKWVTNGTGRISLYGDWGVSTPTSFVINADQNFSGNILLYEIKQS